ncbi:MAG: haloacid dehalogenase-like hydrolase [Monoraphidium minutum]|nr:MAG: haloacid dehalogenase-like hydrolase [Monoraphidium minutum]
MAEQGVGSSAEAEAFMQAREDAGETCVLVAVDRALVAVLAVSDPLKPEARSVVAGLQKQGYECHLLTGDTWRTARAIGRALRIRSVQAEVLPAGKAAVVQEQQSLGRVVAMVGDGVNDSPALAAADVGMAIGSGTDIAVEAADYVLMRDSVDQVLVALDLSRATYRRIQYNFVWAMGYNVVMIPLAAGVLYPWFHIQLPPWAAGGCMVLSSVSVVLSSLMLRHYRPPRLPATLASVRVVAR